MINDKILKYINNYKEIIDINKEIENAFLEQQVLLFKHHYDNCKAYKAFVQNIFQINSSKKLFPNLEDLPYLPVSAFKSNDLLSISRKEIYKTLLSSGTTSQLKSKIYLNKQNAVNQSLTLSKIFTEFTGLKRPKLLIIDSPETVSSRQKFNARAAGIIGFSQLCRLPKFALNDDMSVSIDNIISFIEKIKDENFLVFGFTFIIWIHFLKEKLPLEVRKVFNERAILLHGGGWKKIETLGITRAEFIKTINENIGIKKVINYYGMVEQTGSIFMECEHGFLHSNYACDIISRCPKTLKVSNRGEKGIAQVFSSLPISYPGNSLLTEDLVEISEEKICKCGRTGKAFRILGRIKNVEARGCSDTYSN